MTASRLWPAVAAALTAAIAAAQPRPLSRSGAIDPVASAARGITGFAEFDAGGPRLRAHSGQKLDWPLVARVVSADPLPGSDADRRTRYRVAFIGTIAGEFDLRDCLERQDGSPLDLPILPVRILTQLDADAGADLFTRAQAPPLEPSRYRAVLIGLASAWLAVPVVYAAVRLARRRPAPRLAPVVPPPTLADQLRPLVDAAATGTLSVADRGRLELLLYLYWRARLAIAGPQRQVISILRTHAEAGALLQAVERWLHAPRASAADADAEAAALLEPYRHAPAIADEGAGP